MNEAIKLAIEKGGYDGAIGTEPAWDWHMSDFQNRLVLDPLFWQALGKALGWDDTELVWVCNEGCDQRWLLPDERHIDITCTKGHQLYERPVPYYHASDTEWYKHAHQYFDLALTGGDTEKFWKDILL